MAASLGFAPAAAAQPPASYSEEVKALTSQPEIKAALDFVDGNRDETLREWIAITEVNAPSGKEQKRAAYIEKILRGYRGLRVSYDAAGNLIAVRPGAGAGPRVVVDAHLDTGFKEGWQIKARSATGASTRPRRRRDAQHRGDVGDDPRDDHARIKTRAI